MSSLKNLRELMCQRLNAVAEEIFSVFEKIAADYEDEVNRQRRLLDIVWEPELKLHKIGPPQQHVCVEEEVVPTDLQLCNQERSSSLDQEEPQSLQIKEEREGIYSSHEGEQPVLTQETDSFMLTPVNEESDHTEPGPDSDQQPLSDSSSVVKSQDQKGSEHVANNHAESKPEKRRCRKKSDTHTKQKSLKCDTCGKSFRFKSQLTIHLRVHTGEKPYVCKKCGRGCSTKYTLKQHMVTHRELQQQDVCAEEEVVPTDLQLCNQEKSCSLNQEEPQSLQIQEEQEGIDTSHEGEQPVLTQETPVNEESDHTEPEPDSDQQPLSDSSSVAESQESTPQKRRCRKNDHNSDLEKSKSDSSTNQKSEICNICGKSFTYLSQLTIHMRVHTGEKPYKCKMCGRGFTTVFSRTRHMRTHTGDKTYKRHLAKSKSDTNTRQKPLKCDTCGKPFKYESHLKIHQRRHTGEKPYVCNVCRRRFRTESVMKRHMILHRGEKPFPWHSYPIERKSDTHTGEKSFKCHNCEESYSSLNYVRLLRRNYAKEKKYACIPCFEYLKFRKQSREQSSDITVTDTHKEPHFCKICGRKIASKGGLMIHMRTHTDEKPFCCDMCGKRFNWQTSLDIHIRSHTKEKAFFCHICGKSYTQYTGWKCHMRIHGDSDSE